MIRLEKAPSTTSAWGHFGLTCFAMLAFAGLLAAPAPASVAHPFLFSFGPNGTSKSHFSVPGPIAVDQSSHDVYVTDLVEPTKDKVWRFTCSATCTPDNFTAGPDAGTNKLTGFSFRDGISWESQVAVPPPGAAGGTEGDIYVVAAPGIQIYSREGELLGSLNGSGNPHPSPESGGSLCGVTTDPAGNVYLAYRYVGLEFESNGHIDKYVPSGDPVTNADFDSEIYHVTDPCNLAASSSALYAVRSTNMFGANRTIKYPTSLFPGSGGSTDVSVAGTTIPVGGAQSVAVDPSNEDVYVASSSGAAVQFDKEGNGVSAMGTPNAATGVGVEASSGDVFVSSGDSNPTSTSQVYVFGKGETVNPPIASIDPVTTFTHHSAHFSGKVNSGGTKEAEATTYRFQCSPECPGLQGPRPIPTDAADHEVFDDASGLEPETSYEVTLIATNTGNETKATTTFETPAKPASTAPIVTIDPVTTFSDHSAHLSGTVDPGGLGENQATTYHFEYSLDDSKWSALKDQGPIEGLGPQAVSDDLEGLQPNTAYFVRLHAENVGSDVTSEAPDPVFITEAVAPLAEATGPTHVLSESAQLNARVNPRNSATVYYFQWGTGDCAETACASIPLTQDAEAGSGGAFLFVDAPLSGLAPATTYHYRLIAENAGGETATPSIAFTTEAAAGPCPNEALRSGASANLPDCRAYEMVSPPNKGGGDVTPIPRRTRVAADGNAINYQSTADFGGSEGSSATGIDYLGERDAEGWSTHSIFPHQSSPGFPGGFSGSEYTGEFTSDLSKGVFEALAPVPGAGSANVDGQTNLYLGTNLRGAHPSFQLLSDSTNPLGEAEGETAPHIKFAAASADLSHVVFEDTDNLTPDATGEERKVYESVNGALSLAGILPDSACGSPPCPAPASSAGSGALTPGGPDTLGDGMNTQLSHAISADGSKVFFTAGALVTHGIPSDDGVWGHLYMRENGATTTQIDASERTDCADHNPCSGAPEPSGAGLSEFQFATPDGSKVFFISEAELTNEDTDGSGASLYRYEVSAPAGQHLILIHTATVRPTHVVGISTDGSYVYFLGQDPADSTPNEYGNGAQRLYAYHDGSLQKVAIKENSSLNWNNASAIVLGENKLRVSTDGRHVLFASYRDQGLGYDTHGLPGTFCGPGGGNQDNGRCYSLFLYTYNDNKLLCVSCNPSGEPPVDNANFVTNIGSGPGGDGDTKNINTPMSANGRYVFFNTAEALVPKDSNGQLDAYEYDSESGKLHLLSTGLCNCPSAFVSAGPDGRDAFFTTRQQLVRIDTDNLIDMYDARVNGGIASQNAVAPAQCEGDACLAAPSPPLDATPGSAGFNGPGNPTAHKKHKHRHKRRHHHKRQSHKKSHKARAAGHNSRGAK